VAGAFAALMLAGCGADDAKPLATRAIAFSCHGQICVWDAAAASPRMLARTKRGGSDGHPE
jgi:hypothetical protein